MSKEENAGTVISSLNLSELEKVKLNEDIERATRREKALLEQRKKAPKDAKADAIYTSPRDALVARLVPEALPKVLPRGMMRNKMSFNDGATVRVIFDSPDKHTRHIDEGWNPVVENGMHVSDGGDLMYKRAIELTRDKKLASAKMSRDRLMAEMKRDSEGIDKSIVPDAENVLVINKG